MAAVHAAVLCGLCLLVVRTPVPVDVTALALVCYISLLAMVAGRNILRDLSAGLWLLAVIIETLPAAFIVALRFVYRRCLRDSLDSLSLITGKGNHHR